MSGMDTMDNAPDGTAAASLPVAVAARLTLGGWLSESRAASGRELADVARETRVPLRHLMAIEADDHQSLPALPYALGFVKSYARAIGLNAEAAAAQFRAETSLTPHVPAALKLRPLSEARLPSRRAALGSLALLVVLIAGLGLYGAGVFDPAPVAVADAGLAAPLQPELEPAAGSAAPQGPAVAENSALPASGAAAAALATPAIPASGAVAVVAKADVWIKIYDRSTGQRAFMGVLNAGQRFDVPADGPPLTLRAGRAGMVQISVDGTDLPALGGPVSTIDGVLLTAPALAARFALIVQPAASQPAPQLGAARPSLPVRPPGD